MAKTGRPLLDCITTELRRREETSRFVASLRLPDRLSLTDPDQPVGAIGAALAGRGAI
jgi:glucokinase